MNPYLWFLLVYSVLLIIIGVAVSRRVRSASDFYVAGRKLGPGLLFSTLLAANIGAASTVGAAGLGYQYGMSAWWWVGSAGLGSLVLAGWVGPKMWRLATVHDFLTVGDFLEWRYSRSVRLLAAALLWLGTLALLAAQLIAISIILQVVGGLPRTAGYWVGGGVVIIYFAAGGLWSAARVNALELGVKLVGLLAALGWTMHSAGGWAEIVRRASSALASQSRVVEYFSPVGAGPRWIANYLILLAPSFFISPGLLQKVFGARDEHTIRWGVGLNAVGLIAFAIVPALFGVTGLALFPNLGDPQMALPTLLLHFLPLPLGALALAAVFSAEISTCDAILFMLSTSWSNDLYRTLIHPPANSRELLWAGRVAAVAGGLAAIGLAQFLHSIVGAIAVFYGLLVVSLFMPVLAGLYSSIPGALTAFWSMVLSVITAGSVHLATGGKGVGIFSAEALGILVSIGVFLIGAVRRVK